VPATSSEIRRRAMNLPARYPYDPRWQIVAISWTSVAALTIAVFILGAYRPRDLGIAVALLTVFACLGGLTTLRRYAFPRSLLVDEDGIWLPSGFLRLNVRRVDFAETSDVWEAFIPRTVTLCLRCNGKSYEVLSTLLPDHETYLEVAGYIYSRVGQVADA
jgi:hypothetical protein